MRGVLKLVTDRNAVVDFQGAQRLVDFSSVVEATIPSVAPRAKAASSREERPPEPKPFTFDDLQAIFDAKKGPIEITFELKGKTERGILKSVKPKYVWVHQDKSDLPKLAYEVPYSSIVSVIPRND